jgi:hypothetical protein
MLHTMSSVYTEARVYHEHWTQFNSSTSLLGNSLYRLIQFEGFDELKVIRITRSFGMP